MLYFNRYFMQKEHVFKSMEKRQSQILSGSYVGISYDGVNIICEWEVMYHCNPSCHPVSSHIKTGRILNQAELLHASSEVIQME